MKNWKLAMLGLASGLSWVGGCSGWGMVKDLLQDVLFGVVFD